MNAEGSPMACAVCSQMPCVCGDTDEEACDHEWEYSEYDPSVGMMNSYKICVLCGKTAEDDRGEPDDRP